MPEEIKFRAWDCEYHYMYQNAYPFEHLVYVEMFDDDETFQQFKHKMMNVNGKWFYWIIAKDMVVMQFTGLRDKNGKEIYEGDIVQRGYLALNNFSKFGEEPWNHLPEGVDEGDITTVLEMWGVASDLSGWQHISEAALSNPDVVGVEIIGNIYENPDLMIGPGFVR